MNINTFAVIVKQGNAILNAFNIPAKNYPSAQFHANAIVLSLYPQMPEELEIIVKRV